MRELTRAAVILFVLALPLYPAGIASAEQREPTGELDLLKVRIDLAIRFRELAPKSHGEWGSLEAAIADAESLRQAWPGREDVDAVYRDVVFRGAKSQEELGKAGEALSRYEALYAFGSATPEYAAAALGAGRITEKLAEGAARDEQITRYRKAREYYRAGAAAAEEKRVLEKLIALLSGEGLKAFDDQRFDDALARLSEVEKENPGDFGETEPGRRLKGLREASGYVVLAPIEVKIAGTPIFGKAQVELTARGSGVTRKARDFFEKVRWPYGDYDVKLTAGGGVTLLFPLAHRGPETKLDIPSQIPAGMVFIPAGGGGRAFLIDRTEVSIADYSAWDRSYRPVSGKDPRFPAHDIRFEKAQEFAKARGKDLPTDQQWLRAAFGDDANRRYPWGNDAWSGRCNVGSGKLEPVDAYADKGASPYGVLNMAGNVWEWLRRGYALGGSTASDALDGEGFNFLRDPRPDESQYNGMGPADKRRYETYRFSKDSDNYPEVGFRCVIEL